MFAFVMIKASEERIKLIFGLKVAQARSDKGYSLSQLSKACGLSASYLNEIEKGKKYPKAEKIVSLAAALDLEYDDLISTKLKADLAPLGQLISSNFFTQLPFELFGLEAGQLVDLLSKSPAQAAAFLGAFMDLARTYRIPESDFYLAALRSYQEIANNYFVDIEEEAKKCLKALSIDPEQPNLNAQLQKVLEDKYGYTLDWEALAHNPLLRGVKSYYKDDKSTCLYLEPGLSPSQQAFILAKELAYNWLALDKSVRVNTVDGKTMVESFDQVLVNFKASYFAGALALPLDRVAKDLEQIFGRDRLDASELIDLAAKWHCSPETLMHRMTNILPHKFGLDVLFFSKFNGKDPLSEPHLERELHLNRKHLPHANRRDAHYCGRWLSLKMLNKSMSRNDDSILADYQISEYGEGGDKFLVLSMARRVSEAPFACASASLGIHISNKSKRKIKSLAELEPTAIQVNTLCEYCSISDCAERRAPASALQRKDYRNSILQELAKLQ